MSNDNWQTPQWLFDELNKEFDFSWDVCASFENAKCLNFFTEKMNCLIQPWSHSNFMNPPFSNPKPFVEKAWDWSQYGLVVCILKVDTSTKWWSVFWDYKQHQPKPGCKIRFFPKRIKFEPPPNTNGDSGPTFPTCIVIMDRRKNERD